jgi:predicted DNA-binding protein (MmcQ/YjbR family)
VTLDAIRRHCLALPGATEDVKWEHALVFSVAGKMFTSVSLEVPHDVWFRCDPEEFAELVERPGIVPAPYLARAWWVSVGGEEAMDAREMRRRLTESYEIVKTRLPKKTRESLGQARGPKRTA